MDPFTIFAVASAVFGGVSTIQSMGAAKSSRKAQAAQRDMANLRAAKERRSAIRDARMAYAAAQNRSELGGVAESSGAVGGQASIMTQGNSNIHFLDGQKMGADVAGSWLDRSASQQTSAQLWGGLSELAMSGANYFGMSAKAPSGTNSWGYNTQSAALDNSMKAGSGSLGSPNGYFPPKG